METINDVMIHLTATQLDALAAKFAAQPKAIKKAVRVAEIDGDEATQYAVYILQKTANDYINGQMRDVWIQRLELLVPRVNTSDEKLRTATEKAIVTIAGEIEDVDQREEIQTILKKNLLPKSTDAFNLLKCFERTAELFKAAYGK